MPRYFFDIHDGSMTRDDVGTDCADLANACKRAKTLLPELALHEVPPDGDRKPYTVLVRGEANKTVYSATLSFVGLLL